MKCPVCNGTTKRKTIFGFYTECGFCNGTGEIEETKTNFEYMKTCDKKELVEFLCKNFPHPCGMCDATGCYGDCDVPLEEEEKMISKWLEEVYHG